MKPYTQTSTAMTESTVRGAILAGGKASRFHGRPKGLEEVGGERILDRMVRVVQAAIGNTPVLIANDKDAESWHEGLTVVGDIRPGCGSLGGIYSALAGSSDRVLVVAWDMPFVTVELLQTLLRNAEGYDVYLPQSHGPLGWEPLCGIYGPNCLGPIKTALDHEDYRAGGFHEHVRVGFLPLDEVERCGNVNRLFFNVNTDDDAQKAEELWNQPHD